MSVLCPKRAVELTYNGNVASGDSEVEVLRVGSWWHRAEVVPILVTPATSKVLCDGAKQSNRHSHQATCNHANAGSGYMWEFGW